MKKCISMNGLMGLGLFAVLSLIIISCQKSDGPHKGSVVLTESRIGSYSDQVKLIKNVASIENNKIPDEFKSKVIRVAAAQFTLGADINYNTTKIKELLYEAAQNNVELVVYPETAITGYIPSLGVEKTEDHITQEEIVSALDDIISVSKELSIAIAIGTAWQDENKVWWNRAFFVDENGVILDYYDKIQLTNKDKIYFEEGKRLKPFVWRGLHVGMLICKDQRYPELWRQMRMQGAQLMLHLVAAYGSGEWKVPVLEGTIRGHAASNGYYIVSANNAGPVQMVISAIYDPVGLIVAKANYGLEELIFSDLEIGAPKGYLDMDNEVYDLSELRH